MRAPRLRAAIAVAAVAVIGVAGCASSDRDSGADTAKDTLVFGVAGDAKVLDPALASDGESLRVARQIYQTLVSPEEGGTKTVPGLAETWTPDATGLVWTFKLKQGVKFHDGSPFNGQAVCDNFNRWYNFSGLMQSPDVSAYWQDVWGGFAKNENADLGPSLFKSCTVKDDTTVDIAINSVSSKFPAALALPSFSISSPTALKQFNADQVGGTADNITYPEYAMAHPVGTGPYKFVRWDTANKTITLERFDDFAGDKAKIKNLIFKTISDENARKQAMRTGEIQGYDLVAPADVAALKGEGFNVLTRPAFNVLYLAFNQAGNPALAKPEVRQAIAYAINRDAIVKSKYPEGSTVAVNFQPPTLAGFNDAATKYPYDVNKAKSMLAAAGASNLTLKFHYPTEVSRPYMPSPKDIHELIKADLEAAGIKVQAIPLKWNPDYLNAVTSGKNHDLHLLGWTGDYADAYNFIGTFFARPKDEWGFNNAALFAEFATADKEPDTNKRTELYKALNAKLLDFMPGVPIANGPPSLVLAKNVTGVKPSPLTDERYYTASYTS